MGERIRIGISACLLGERTRYDGGHRLDRYLARTVGRHVEYMAVCPEYECGLGVPRESMRLVGDPLAPRLATIRTKRDVTARVSAWARARVGDLGRENLCGFIFKADSPSCGVQGVEVWNDSGAPVKRGAGIFAGIFMERFPLIPVEDDDKLHDPGLRENFIERVFAMRRWRETIARGRTLGNLVRFHSENKLLIMAHSEKHMREMGRLVSGAKGLGTRRLFDLYQEMLLDALRLKATVSKNVNVLQHIMGYFKVDLSVDEKREMAEVLQSYKTGRVPLIVPVALVNHYVRKYKASYLLNQHYLKPHPVELALRNHP